MRVAINHNKNFLKRIFILILLALFTFTNISHADYVCIAKPISILLIALDYYNINEDFTVVADVLNNPSSNPVYARLIDESGRVVQEAVGQKDLFSTKYKFNFYAVSEPGEYKLKVYLIDPRTNKEISEYKKIKFRELLTLKFTTKTYSHPILNDLILYLDIIPPDIQTTKKLNAYLDGKNISINPLFIDKGGGSWEIKIPGSQLNEVGSLDLEIVVSDIGNVFGETRATIKSISLIKPKLNIQVSYPQTAEVDKPYEIKINIFGIGGDAVNVDNLEMKVTYPGGQEKIYKKSDFLNSKTGEYIITYKFTTPTQYYFLVSAWKDGYISNKNEFNVAVSGVGRCGNGKCEEEFGENNLTCPQDCKQSFCGDGICGPGETSQNCPQDCGGINWFLIIVAVLVIVIVLIFVLKR
jgi:uncharacterized integral membrane protein